MSAQNESVQARLHHLERRHVDRVTAFRQRLAQIGYDRVLVLLLDMGKNVHWATALTAAGQELIRPFKLPTTYTGLSRFFALTDPLIGSSDFDFEFVKKSPEQIECKRLRIVVSSEPTSTNLSHMFRPCFAPGRHR